MFFFFYLTSIQCQLLFLFYFQPFSWMCYDLFTYIVYITRCSVQRLIFITINLNTHRLRRWAKLYKELKSVTATEGTRKTEKVK